MATLWQREIVRFLRQRSRVAGALGSPLVFWLLMGSGFGSSFRPASGVLETGYLEYFFPGTVLMILLFTSIFSNISVIEERREGFLLSVLVAPASRLSLVLGKILGVTTLAVLQGGLFVLLAPLLGISLRWTQWIPLFAVIALIAVELTALGFAFAWKLDSIQGFHALMNLLLVPLWLLSGALFPMSGASSWVRAIMMINPMTYAMSALRQVLYSGTSNPMAEICSLPAAILVTGFFGLGMIVVSVVLVSRRAL
ncbi:MAG: ABC transporter permease [Acidobacteria bacterium]|nr:ABC transporter permease [Acidobacteriota bacterium]MCI0720216.1 ABC transporter permease [Acidobacteriota bacterium]